MTLTPYAWLTGISGRMGFAGSVSDVDLNAGDVLSQTDISVMALLEARRGPWIARVDVSYVSLSDRKAVEEGGGSPEVIFTLDQGMAQPEVGYALVDRVDGGVDALIGGRFLHPKVSASADLGQNTTSLGSGSHFWADATAGIAAHYLPTKHWNLFAKGDVGTGGSKLSWQALAGTSYDISDCCNLSLAYRRLDVNYDRDEFVNDTYLWGFALGLGIRF